MYILFIIIRYYFIIILFHYFIFLFFYFFILFLLFTFFGTTLSPSGQEWVHFR